MEKKKRKSIRLKSWDYTTPWQYFVTICTKDRKCLFGNVANNGKMMLNDIGRMVDNKINELHKYKNINVDIYSVMPNHIHMIVVLVGPNTIETNFVGMNSVGADPRVRPFNSRVTLESGSTQGSTPTLGEYIKRFKTLTTRMYIENVNNNNWPLFNKRIWQRNYYEHIIRTEDELNRIRSYIAENPNMWDRDRNNPENLDTKYKYV